MLNGIAENVAGTTDALGECAANAAARLLTTVPLASRVQDAEASCNIKVGTIWHKGCDPVVGQEIVTAATRCCRTVRDVDIYQINVRSMRSDNISVRSGPVARGGDVNDSTSDAERHQSGSTGFGSFLGRGVAANMLMRAVPEGVRCMASVNARVNRSLAAIFRAAFKSSGKHVAAVAIPMDCRLPIT